MTTAVTHQLAVEVTAVTGITEAQLIDYVHAHLAASPSVSSVTVRRGGDL